MVVARGVVELIWRSPNVVRTVNRKKVATYFEYKVSVKPRDEGLDRWSGKHGAVNTDIQFTKDQYRQRSPGSAVLFRHRILKLTPVKARDTDRLDLQVGLPKASGWGPKMIATRIFGYHFLNTSRKLTRTQYQKPHPYNRRSYFYQVHHVNEDPSRTLADKLQILDWHRNESGEIARQQGGVKRRPAAAPMRAPRHVPPRARAAPKPRAIPKARLSKRPAGRSCLDKEVDRIIGQRARNAQLVEERSRTDPRNDPVRRVRSRFWRQALLERALELGPLSEDQQARILGLR